MRLFKKLSRKPKAPPSSNGADIVSEGTNGRSEGPIQHLSSAPNEYGNPPTYEQATAAQAEAPTEAPTAVPAANELSSTSNEFKVTVAPLDDNSTIGLSRAALGQLQVSHGEVVLVTGPAHRDTVQIAITHEIDDEHAHINEAVCRQLGATHGDAVTLSRLENQYLKRVAFAPIDDTIGGLKADWFDDFLGPYFREALRPARTGNVFPVKNSLGTVEFRVVECDPAEWGIVTEETVLYVVDPISRAEAKPPYKVGYADIGGYHTQMSKLKQLVEAPLLHSGRRPNSDGVGAASRGLLLHGPAGTGKSKMVRALAVETGSYHFLIDTPLRPEQIQMAFKEAKKNRPALVQIDNIDLLAPKRETATHDAGFLSGLLAMFDQFERENERQVVVVGTTTNLKGVDLGLRRSGYLDQEVELGLPSKMDRLEMLRIHLKKANLSNDVDMDELALRTEGYSGADIIALCRNALLKRVGSDNDPSRLGDGEEPGEAMNGVTLSMEDFISSLKDE